MFTYHDKQHEAAKSSQAAQAARAARAAQADKKAAALGEAEQHRERKHMIKKRDHKVRHTIKMHSQPGITSRRTQKLGARSLARSNLNTSTHARMYTHTHAHTRTRKHAHTHACKHAHTHARTHAGMHARTHARKHAHKHARTHTRMHIRTCAYTHARKQAHTHARIHARTQTRTHSGPGDEGAGGIYYVSLIAESAGGSSRAQGNARTSALLRQSAEFA
jgi:hypothetical protein